MSKKTRNAKKIKMRKLVAKRARKAAKRKKKLAILKAMPTAPRIDYGDVILGLLEEDGATTQSVYDYIMENADSDELEDFFDATEDLLLDLDLNDAMLPQVKELHALFESDGEAEDTSEDG